MVQDYCLRYNSKPKHWRNAGQNQICTWVVSKIFVGKVSIYRWVFYCQRKKQKVLSYKIGFFLVKLKCWSSKCWNYFLYNFTENCVSSSHYSVTVMWTGSDIRTRRWQNQYLWLLCSLSLSGGLQTTFRTITLKKTKWFRSWFNKCWLKGWRVLHKYLTRFSLKFRLFTFVKILQNCTTTIPSCLINLMALTRSDKWKRITILNFRIHC